MAYLYQEMTPEIKQFVEEHNGFFSAYVLELRKKDRHTINLIDDSNEIYDNILTFSKMILEKNGYKCMDIDLGGMYDPLFEIHNINLTDDEYIENAFTRHMDDYGGVSCKVNTMIYYLEKSPTLDGGNLVIYKNDKDNYGMRSDKSSHSDDGIELEIKPNTYLLLRGDVEHSITPCTGSGNRTCVVIQIARID